MAGGFWHNLLAADTALKRWCWNGLTALGVGAILLLVTWYAHRRHRADVIDRRLANLREVVDVYAARNELPTALVMGIIRCESGGDPRAHSRKDAKGLMQITRNAELDALRFLHREERGDLFDPDYNLEIGTAYLGHLYRRFQGDLPLVLAAYHMGQSRVAALRVKHPEMDSLELVESFGGPQTISYTRRVINLYELERERERYELERQGVELPR